MLKTYFDNLLKNFLILSAALQLSCGTSHLSKKEEFLITYDYKTYNEIRSIESTILGNDLKVKFKVREKKTREPNIKIGTEILSNTETLSINDSPKGTSAYINLNSNNPQFTIINPNKSNRFVTDSLGEIVFLIRPDKNLSPYFNLTALVPHDRVLLYDYRLKANIQKEEEIIGRVIIDLEYEPFFMDRVKPSEPDKYFKNYTFAQEQYKLELEVYHKYDFYKREFKNRHRTFSIYAIPTELMIQKREKEKQDEIKRKRLEEENRRKQEIAEENRKKDEKEMEKNENERLTKLIHEKIYKNLGVLEIHVSDEDNGLQIHGAGVSITSNAQDPVGLLLQNGFPRNRIYDFNLPNYPNSWDDRNWGNGHYCEINNKSCSFQVYKPAKHKIVVKHPAYYQVDAEIIPSRDGLDYIVEMSKIGTKVRIDMNLFGGKGNVRKK